MSRWPAITEPEQTLESLHNTVLELKQLVEILTQQRGEANDHAVTFQDLTDAGLLDAGAISDLASTAYVDAADAVVTAASIQKSLLTTRGDLIRRGAAAPERVALGTTGQVLASDGTDAAWATLGGWKQLVAPTSQSTKPLDIVLTSYTAYRAIRVIITNIDLSADDDLFCRTSTDGGSTFDSGAANYSWVWDVADSAGGSFDADTSGDTEMDLGYFGSASAECGNLDFIIWNQTDATHAKVCSWDLVGLEGSASEPVWVRGAGRRSATTDVDALRFQPYSATWSYTYSVYGLV